MKQAIQQNLIALKQGVDLLAGFDVTVYRRSTAEVFDSTIGGHFRHILDHYDRFFRGLDDGRVDYAARDRDGAIESNPERAVEALRNTCRRLGDLERDGPVGPLKVALDGPDDRGQPSWAESSVERELDFLLSHTIHHEALIAVLCRMAGRDVPAEFGVAPSTQRHRRSHGLCAR